VGNLRRYWKIPRYEPPVTPPEGELLSIEAAAKQLARKIHRRMNRRSGECVQRVESIEPNENAPRRFFADRL
jgi:hypothetical protein